MAIGPTDIAKHFWPPHKVKSGDVAVCGLTFHTLHWSLGEVNSREKKSSFNFLRYFLRNRVSSIEGQHQNWDIFRFLQLVASISALKSSPSLILFTMHIIFWWERVVLHEKCLYFARGTFYSSPSIKKAVAIIYYLYAQFSAYNRYLISTDGFQFSCWLAIFKH